MGLRGFSSVCLSPHPNLADIMSPPWQEFPSSPRSLTQWRTPEISRPPVYFRSSLRSTHLVCDGHNHGGGGDTGSLRFLSIEETLRKAWPARIMESHQPLLTQRGLPYCRLTAPLLLHPLVLISRSIPVEFAIFPQSLKDYCTLPASIRAA